MTQPPKKEKGIADLFRGHAGAATMAGVLEIAFFHPFDTVAKRLMSNRSHINSLSSLNKTIFKDRANATLRSKFVYLYPGGSYAMVYKVLQRVYKFAGQPYVRSIMDSTCGESISKVCGSKTKLVTESVSGSLIGIGEVVLLPLDRLKVLSQTNPDVLKGRGVLSVFAKEGFGMYAGTLVTMTRNAPGSFCLFGGAAFTKDIIFGLDDYGKASFTQNMAASTVGSVLSITVTNPMDVIKTRIQNKPFGTKVSGGKVLLETIKEEGFSALLKGSTPKVIASAPKLVFAYTMTEYFKQLMTKL